MIRAAKLAAAIGLLAILACSGGAQIGSPCDNGGDCASDLQCFAGTCTAQCTAHFECGDGYRCDGGQCTEVQSAVGDSCSRELDCGLGQTCLVNESDPNDDGLLAANCAIQLPGASLGTPCVTDTDCRSGSCNLARCTEVCLVDDDCGSGLTCTQIPRVVSDGPALFSGCFQEGGSHALNIPLSASRALTSIPVPGNARSFALTATSADPDLVTGVTFLATPTGAIWYQSPLTLDDYLANPIRYAPAQRESTLLAPNRPDLVLAPGSYAVRVGTSFSNGEPAQQIPSVRVLYKLHDDAVLDVNVHILDLANHPCEAEIGGARLSAQTAATHPGMITLVEQLTAIFSPAQVQLGTVSYHDIVDHPELDALDVEDLDDLIPLARAGAGLNLFLVRSIAPGGVQVIGGGNPASPRYPGSRTAGVALSMDTLCYRDWATASRMVAHSFGLQMGLFRNREPDSAIQDPIFDSEPDTNNLMFFTEFGGTDISDGQANILRRYPGLRQIGEQP